MTGYEFNIIETYFSRLVGQGEQALGLKDDAAVFSVPNGMQLVVSTDTLNAGVHFIDDARPEDIAHKALRVNLSDMAAMGAEPYCYQLAMAFPEKPEKKWLEDFTSALLEDQEQFGIFCSGGDTTSIKGALSISVTIIGLVPAGAAIKRSGAKAGDKIMLTGPVGDAYIGLKALRGELDNCFNANVVKAYTKPTPRLDAVDAIRAHAHAAIDISDGLIADLGHICMASGLGAHVQISDDIFSKSGLKLIETGALTLEQLLTGGDDYQLLLAVPQEAVMHFPDAHVIGTFHKDSGVVVETVGGEVLDFIHTGWSHF